MRPLLLFVFFLSGLSALGLETLWTRLFSFVFGGTALSMVTVLTAYMTGLAWGSSWGGRRADHTRRPLVTYAWLEAGIGIWGMLMPLWIVLVAPLHQWSTSILHPTLVALLKFILATLTMLLPTAMMGATLPVLSRYFAQKKEQVGFDVGLLYTVNTAGAVSGCLLTGFFFLPLFGIQATIYVLGGLNLCLALTVGWFGRNTIVAVARSEESSATDETEAPTWLSWQRFLPTESQAVLYIFTASGGLAMLCQVCWNRVLTLVIGSSIYAFTIILSTFLLGLTVGSSVGSWWTRRMKDPVFWLSVVLGLIAALVWGSIVLVDDLPIAFLHLAQTTKLTPLLLFSMKALLAAMLVFFPTFAMGLMFPLVIRCIFQNDNPIGQTVGRVYAYNTTGAIVGSFASGFVIIPWLGMQGALIAVVLVYLFLAVGLFLLREQTTSLWIKSCMFTGMGSLLLVTLFATPSWNRSRLSLGLFRIAQLKRLNPNKLIPRKLIDYREGLHATVVVEQYDRHVIALKVNGKTDASSGVDMPTQMLSALLPLSLHGKAKEVLVIGWGSGVTAGTALQFPIKHLTAVEIEPAVVEAAKVFQPWNYKPRQDPRLKLVFDDGRNFLHSRAQHYDAIISEPSNPWISGVASLFTQEFFRLAKRRLAGNGMLCQWIQLYELSPENIRVLLNTVSSVFPYVYLFGISHSSRDTLLIATSQPLQRRLRTLAPWFRQPTIKRAFLRAGLRSPVDFLPRLLADNESIRALVKGAPLNTDDNAWIELRAPLNLLTHASSDGSDYLRKALGTRYNRFQRVFPQGNKKSQGCIEPNDREALLFLARLRFGDHQRGQQDLHKLCQGRSTSPGYKLAQHIDLLLQEGIPALESCLQRAGQRGEHLDVIRCWNQDSHAKITEQQLTRWAKQPKSSPEYRMLYGILRYARRQNWKSLKLLTPLVQDSSWLQKHPLLYYMLGQLYRKRKIWPEAVWFTGHYISARSR